MMNLEREVHMAWVDLQFCEEYFGMKSEETYKSRAVWADLYRKYEKLHPKKCKPIDDDLTRKARADA